MNQWNSIKTVVKVPQKCLFLLLPAWGLKYIHSMHYTHTIHGILYSTDIILYKTSSEVNYLLQRPISFSLENFLFDETIHPIECRQSNLRWALIFSSHRMKEIVNLADDHLSRTRFCLLLFSFFLSVLFVSTPFKCKLIGHLCFFTLSKGFRKWLQHFGKVTRAANLATTYSIVWHVINKTLRNVQIWKISCWRQCPSWFCLSPRIFHECLYVGMYLGQK